MENLAKAIVDTAHMFGQALTHLASNQANVDTLSSIIGNLASFATKLSLEIAKLIQ